MEALTEPRELTGLTDLDAAGVLAAATGSTRSRRLAEVRDLRVLLQWAVLHESDPTAGPEGAYDHPTPYILLDHGGPPGRTGTHNSGPLARRRHKWKTHAGYRARQSGRGRYVWTTPHGLAFIVDHTGAHPIDPTQTQAILDAPAGLEIYFAPLDIQIDYQPN